MADEDDEKRKLEDEAEAEGSPDDVIAGPDAPVDPQIMSMTGMPQTTAAPVNDMFRRGGIEPNQRTLGGPPGAGGPMGGPPQMGGGGMGHQGWLQQLMGRIQQARQAREAQRGERMQQFAGTPFGQQFMAGPMGQRMQQQHPGWFPQAGAPGGAPAPANIVEGDHTGMPAEPPTAAAAAQQQATAAAQAPAAPEHEETTTTTKTKRPFRDQQPQQRQPVQQARPQQAMQRPTLGGAGANDAIAQALRARNGGGGRRMF